MENNRIYKYSLALALALALVLVLVLSGCDKPEPAGQNNAELAQYLQRITGDLVFIPGGTFWMGEFLLPHAWRGGTLLFGKRYQTPA